MNDQTPEALEIPRYNPLKRLNVAAPYNPVAAANTPKTIYNEATEQVCSMVVIQNQCAFPVLICFNSPAGPGTFNRILAACVASQDGLGGNMEIDVQGKGIRSISAYAVGGALELSVERYQRDMLVGAP